MRLAPFASTGWFALAVTGCISTSNLEPGLGPNPLCALSMPVQGAASGTLTADACGEGSDQELFFNDFSLSSASSPGVRIVLPSALTAGQTGTTAAQVAITETSGGSLGPEWETPLGACQITIASNVKSGQTDPFGAPEYTVAGHGSCSAPAMAIDDGGASGAVRISPFSFQGYIVIGP